MSRKPYLPSAPLSDKLYNESDDSAASIAKLKYF